jgi:XRE family transcriptional regulator, regulator of sulfur utilization
MKESGAVESTLTATSLGVRVRELRTTSNLSLEALAGRAEVSRSMLSSIERGEKVASVLVVDRIATALGTTLARLLGEQRDESVIVLRRDEQDVVVDPGGWERRILSPVLPGVEFELMRTTLGPSVNAGAFAAHGAGSREYVAIEAGSLLLTLEGRQYTLEAGAAIFFDGDCVHEFENPCDEPCVYYLAMDVTGGGRAFHRRVPASERRAR